MRVVFDTNVLISGLLWKGATSALFDLVDDGSVELCVTPAIIEEINRVIAYSKITQQLRRVGVNPEDVLEYLLQHALVFEDVTFVRLVTDDPSDNMFINCAIISSSEWLVSGDRHLLRVGSYRNIKIVTPARFLQWYETSWN